MQEHGGQVCADIKNVVSGENHWGCGSGYQVEVSDTLDSAWGAGTAAWTVYSTNKGRGSKTGGNSSKSGTITVDMTWAGTGELQTNLKPGSDSPLDLDCWISWETYCNAYYQADQTRKGAIFRPRSTSISKPSPWRVDITCSSVYLGSSHG